MNIEKLIQSRTLRLMHGIGEKFAATESTPTFNKFMTHKFEYLMFVMTNPV